MPDFGIMWVAVIFLLSLYPYYHFFTRAIPNKSTWVVGYLFSAGTAVFFYWIFAIIPDKYPRQ